MAQSESLEKQYVLPHASNPIESARLDEQHNILKSLLNGLYPCPELVSEVLNASDGQTKSVLDLGSGSGAWCLDMARQFPLSRIVGIDIAPNLLPSDVANCRFEVRDITKGLSPFYGQFDFIHMRCVSGLPDHHTAMQEAIRCLKPGGLIMLLKMGACVTQDRMSIYPAATSTTPDGSWWQRLWCSILEPEGTSARGHLTQLYIRDYNAGFWDRDGIDVNTCGAAVITIPMGPWVTTPDPTETTRLRKVGESWKENTMRVNSAFTYTAADFGRSSKETALLHKRVNEELETTRIRCSVPLRAIWGRAEAIRGSAGTKNETTQRQNEAPSDFSDEAGYQVVTYFDTKAAWTKFNTDLQSTMNPDTKALRDVPGFDPIEE